MDQLLLELLVQENHSTMYGETLLILLVEWRALERLEKHKLVYTWTGAPKMVTLRVAL